MSFRQTFVCAGPRPIFMRSWAQPTCCGDGGNACCLGLVKVASEALGVVCVIAHIHVGSARGYGGLQDAAGVLSLKGPRCVHHQVYALEG